ncbi:MAG TPA: TerC family protein [Haliangiales bacterium]|nr:TerC family protein [Haliangiales bacterium]
MAEIFTTENLVSFLTLTLLEIVLGIDNIVFLSILTGKLPEGDQARARRVGLSLALIFRLGLLLVLSWIMGLTEPLFSLFDHGFSGRDLILLGGGLFLVGKSAHEIYDKLEVEHAAEARPPAGRGAFAFVIAQVLVLDIVFSLDSVITAVGMAQDVRIMAAAMVVAVGVMLVSSGAVAGFVNRHPSMKVLALSFLLLIGVMLLAEGMGQHVNKGYIYFAMAFAFAVELLNLRLRRKRERPVKLHGRFEND